MFKASTVTKIKTARAFITPSRPNGMQFTMTFYKGCFFNSCGQCKWMYQHCVFYPHNLAMQLIYLFFTISVFLPIYILVFFPHFFLDNAPIFF
jgi:hypothetical protein